MRAPTIGISFWRMMQTSAGVFVLVLGLAVTVAADPFEDGLAAYNRRDNITALKFWFPLAERGDSLAQAGLCNIYQAGEGVAQNYTEAFRWCRLAANQGHPGDQRNLGFMYELGEGVAQNYAEAARWYRLAADQKDSLAQSSLGRLYEFGKGVPQSNVLAHMWFNLSAARAAESKGRERAIQNRDKLESKMTRAQIDEAQRLAAQWKPK